MANLSDVILNENIYCEKIDSKISFNAENYFIDTFAIFEKRDIEEINLLKPNFVSTQKGYYDKSNRRFYPNENQEQASSRYFYTNDGVYRLSNHWGQCGECFWILCDNNDIEFIAENIDNFESWVSYDDDELGFCSWDKFFQIIEKETKDLPNEYYLAIAFRDIMLTKKVDDITPIHWHKNHHSQNVFVVENLRFF